jgi:hypothetical protein
MRRRPGRLETYRAVVPAWRRAGRDTLDCPAAGGAVAVRHAHIMPGRGRPVRCSSPGCPSPQPITGRRPRAYSRATVSGSCRGAMLEWITGRAESASAVLVSAAGTAARATASSGVLRVFRRAGQHRERLAAGRLAGRGRRRLRGRWDRGTRSPATGVAVGVASAARGPAGGVPGCAAGRQELVGRPAGAASGRARATADMGLARPSAAVTVLAVHGARWSGVTMVALAPAAGRRGE